LPLVSTRADVVDYDPSSYAIQAHPFGVYKRLRNEAPLYRNERLGFWALSRFDDVHAALADPATYSSAEGVQLESSAANLGLQAEMMLNMDPPKHTQMRALVSRAFTPKRIAALEPDLRILCRDLLDRIAARGGGDAVRDYAAVIPVAVITALIGLPDEARDNLKQLTDRINHREPGSVHPPADASVAGADLFRLFAALVAARKEHPADDMATALLAARIEGEDGSVHGLADHQIAMFDLLLAVAGYETTSKLIANAIVALERFADQRRLLLADPARVPAAVEETVRYDGSSQYVARVTTCPVELHGQEVAAGSRVVLVLGAANRDEREFDEPDRFDVTRTIRRHLAFGHGIHYCLGAALARLETKVAIEELLNRFPNYRVDLDRVERKYSSNFRGLSAAPFAVA
jgi:cytochrome P450